MPPPVDARLVPAPALEVIALFVRKEKRERLVALLEKPSRRSDFCDALLHDRRSLDPAVLVPLPPHGLTVESIVAHVGTSGDLAHCIGGTGTHDGHDAPLGALVRGEALRARDVLVFDLTTKRAYYENHEGESFLLRPRAYCG